MTLDEIKLKLQGHFSDGLVTIVGSGLSCSEGLPGMMALADHLRAVLDRDLKGADADIWAKLSPLVASKGLEAALLASPPTPSVEAAIAAATTDLIVASERQIIADVFEGKRTLRFTRLLGHLLKPAAGIPVVTTNYDRLIEIASEEAGLGVDTMFVGSFAGELNEKESRLSFCRDVQVRSKRVRWHYRSRVNLCKPHGSLDWYQREGKPVRFMGDLAMPRLIITPGLNKFRNGYESPFDRHRERANQAIDHASRFLIIGYGFNDDHLETHLTPMIRRGTPTLLLTYALSANAKALVAQYKNVAAIERISIKGSEGSRIIVNGDEIAIPGTGIWDLGEFVKEVLEP